MSEQVQSVSGQTECSTTGDASVSVTTKRTYQKSGVSNDQILAAYHDVKNNTLSDVASSLNMKTSTLSVRLNTLRKKGQLNRQLVRSKAAKTEQVAV